MGRWVTRVLLRAFTESLLRRGKGHAAVHRTGIHGGPSPRVVGAVALVAGTFGAAVLIAEALGS